MSPEIRCLRWDNGTHAGWLCACLDFRPGLTLQTDALTKAGCEKLFTDKVSGAKLNRPGLTEALNFVRAGDTLVIWKPIALAVRSGA
jgi:DNA invertase Pin-like site-specific DNA recombinase